MDFLTKCWHPGDIRGWGNVSQCSMTHRQIGEGESPPPKKKFTQPCLHKLLEAFWVSPKNLSESYLEMLKNESWDLCMPV